MKKTLKVFGLIILSVIILCVGMFSGARYGWKLFNFRYCENPDTLFARNVMVNSEGVFLSGDTSSSTNAYVGYIYQANEKTMYIGIKENAAMGLTSRVSAFNITIPYDTTKLENIYFKKDNDTKLIWSKTIDVKYLGDLTKVCVYKNIPVENATVDQLEKKADGAAYEEMNRHNALRVAQAAYSKELVLWEGDYLAVAILRNGGKLYLKMNLTGDFFRVVGADEYGIYRY